MGDKPLTRHRAQRLRREEAETIIVGWMIAPTSFVTNLTCAAFAAVTGDLFTSAVATIGAGCALYGWLHYAEHGRLPMGYRSLAMQLRGDITYANYMPGHKLPSVGEIAQQYHTTRTTTLRALKVLADEGLIDIIPGRGTYIVGDALPVIGDIRDTLMAHYQRTVDSTLPGTPMPSDGALAALYDADPIMVGEVRAELTRRGDIRATRYGGHVRA